jgi:hypothetical protein
MAGVEAEGHITLGEFIITEEIKRKVERVIGRRLTPDEENRADKWAQDNLSPEDVF